MNREELLAVDDLEVKEIDVPEWKTKLRIRQLGLDDVLRIETITEPLDHAIAAILAGVIDESGTRVFNIEDASALRSRNGNAILRVSKAIFEMSEIRPLEEAAKN